MESNPVFVKNHWVLSESVNFISSPRTKAGITFTAICQKMICHAKLKHTMTVKATSSENLLESLSDLRCV